MQAIGWYAHRLRSMSAPEMWWRLRSKGQESADRWLAFWKQRRLAPAHFLHEAATAHSSISHVIGRHLHSQAFDASAHSTADWRRALVRQADELLSHRIDLFDLNSVDLGPRINWNYEYKAGKAAPMDFAAGIDYRDYSLTGDCKFVWELNRHHQLVVLARAYRATGDERYALGVADMLRDWIAQCPYGRGMNWRSPLELGIRLINWVWSLEMIAPAGALDTALGEAILESAYRHLHDITRKYSQFSSANNHLVGEAAGVFIGSAHFSSLRGARQWRVESKAILEREILAQNFASGANREQAVGYHLFVTQFFLFAGIAGRNSGDDFSPAYWERLERMFEFAAAMTEAGAPGTPPPMFGDADDGYVLDLGGRGDVWRAYLAVAARLFDRPDFAAVAGGVSEPVLWLLGPADEENVETSKRRNVETSRAASLPSRGFADAGCYLLQSGRRGGDDAISVAFDCGEIGFQSIAAHGHADALSFTLRVSGVDVLVDPGTYDYFTYGPWRDYFRSTRAHNTVVVDHQDQSEPLGSFLWGRKAAARCVDWSPGADGGRVAGEHDGYTALSDPVTHRRALALRGGEGVIEVEDDIVAAGPHHLGFHWHFAEHCAVRELGGNRFEVGFSKGSLLIQLDPRLTVRAFCGADDPILGWVSRGYHRKSPATTLVGECEITGRTSFRTEIRVHGEAVGR